MKSLGVCERVCTQNYFDRFSCLAAASRSRSCRLVRPSCWCRSDHIHRCPLHTSLILRRTSRVSCQNLRELLMCLVCALAHFLFEEIRQSKRSPLSNQRRCSPRLRMGPTVSICSLCSLLFEYILLWCGQFCMTTVLWHQHCRYG